MEIMRLVAKCRVKETCRGGPAETDLLRQQDPLPIFPA